MCSCASGLLMRPMHPTVWLNGCHAWHHVDAQAAHIRINVEVRRKNGQAVATRLGLGRIDRALTLVMEDLSAQVCVAKGGLRSRMFACS